MVKAAAPAADLAVDSGPAGRSPLTVVAVTGAVNAVTGVVTAVTWGRDPALDVTGTVPAVIALAGCHSPSRRADRPGHVLLAILGSLALKLLTQRSLARPKLRPLCATRVATLARVDTRCIAVGRFAGHIPVASLVTCLARPRGRVFLPKCPKAETAPLPGKGCHAATGARIVPWRQPGDR
jgi:hypothetical protein